MQPDELLFANGDVIRVIDWSHPEVWYGSLMSGGSMGWFPASYVRVGGNITIVFIAEKIATARKKYDMEDQNLANLYYLLLVLMPNYYHHFQT